METSHTWQIGLDAFRSLHLRTWYDYKQRPMGVKALQGEWSPGRWWGQSLFVATHGQSMVFSSASGGCESKSLLVRHQVCDLGFCLPESSACNKLLIKSTYQGCFKYSQSGEQRVCHRTAFSEMKPVIERQKQPQQACIECLVCAGSQRRHWDSEVEKHLPVLGTVLSVNLNAQVFTGRIMWSH